MSLPKASFRGSLSIKLYPLKNRLESLGGAGGIYVFIGVMAVYNLSLLFLDSVSCELIRLTSAQVSLPSSITFSTAFFSSNTSSTLLSYFLFVSTS